MTTLDIIGMLVAPVGALVLAGLAYWAAMLDERRLERKIAERERRSHRR
ncbi:MAG: hypothetical protein AAF739_09755 [Pseudomonadota bacterium]